MSYGLRSCTSVLLAFGLSSVVAYAQVNDFGVGGVLDVPSARMEPENTFTATYSRKDVADIYAIAYQPFPRLETSFRYIISFPRNVPPVPGSFCDLDEAYCRNQLKDRSFEVKLRLLNESEYLPQVSVGLRDILGTGVFNGEYLVGSKQLGNLDLSVGVGWGRFSERAIMRNPLLELSDRFAVREASGGLGGQFSLRSYFRGPEIGAFGSVRYSIPAWRLDLLAAYNSDSYAGEVALGTIEPPEALSFGIEWEATPGVRLALSRQQGGIAFKLSASLDTGAPPPRKAPNNFGAGKGAATPANFERGLTWWPRLTYDAENSGVFVKDLRWDDEQSITLRYKNLNYQLEADAIRRTLALVDQYVPVKVENVQLVGEALDLPTHTVRYRRPAGGASALLARAASPIDVGPPIELTKPPAETRAVSYPHGGMDLGLNLRAYIFDPDHPFLYQLSLRARGEVELGAGWSFGGIWVQNIDSQFDRIVREGGSALPPVRTDLKRYLQEGESGIDQLALVKRGKVGRDFYYQAYAGILEEMYSGVGAELLWRRADLPFAVGVNVNGVRQREFDKMFGLREYQTVTGHVSFYWATPLKNVDAAVHVGRYLARDTGGTLEVSKRFANGWVVGAFATLTDVPFEVFGEGSFDKGLIFSIPFDLYSPRNTGGGYRTSLRPINRDGGRMLDNWPGNLWENLRRVQRDRLIEYQDRMIPE
jgi:hypothetical protein